MAGLPHVHVFMPEVFAPLALWRQDFGFEADSPALMALLARYQRQSVPVSGLERSILHWLGMDVRQQLPWAVLRHQFESGGAYEPPLLCADPVFMRTGIDSVVLDVQPPQLSRDEVERLLLALNTHLAQDGLVLKAFNPQCWYLHRLGDFFTHGLPSTTPLSEAGAGNVFPYLPQSGDKYWAQLFNEIQMLLHTQPVNQRREDAGLPPVNGVWLWGEGEVAATPLQPVAAVYGGGICGQVVAKRVVAHWSSRAVLSTMPDSGDVLVILDQLRIPALNDEPQDWQAALSGLEGFLSELLTEQRAGRCHVTLHDTAGNSWFCQKSGCWLFGGRKVAAWSEFS